jgi:membrane-bound serine protease (ClpP class)
VRAAGVALILLALVLFLLEIKITSYGALAMGGVAAMLFGSLMLFDSSGGGAGLSLGVIVPSLIVVTGLFLFGVVMAVRAQGRRPVTGAEGLVGEIGEARTDLAPHGQVFVHGELWNATGEAPVARGAAVRVTQVDGLRLRVVAIGQDEPNPRR